MGNKYQEIVFAIEQYHFNNTYEEARRLMWDDITEMLQILFKNEYIAVAYEDETDIIVIQFGHHDRDGSWGNAQPEWIIEDECYDSEEWVKEDEEYNEAETI